MQPVTIRNLCDPDRSHSVIVRGGDPLDDVLRRFSQEVAPRGIFVVDDAGRLAGVITRRDILEWTRLRLGSALRGPGLTTERILRLAQLVRASTARDAIHPGSEGAGVRLDDHLDEALQKMLSVDLISLPVVDEAGHIIGEVAISAVLRMLLDAGDDAAPA